MRAGCSRGSALHVLALPLLLVAAACAQDAASPVRDEIVTLCGAIEAGSTRVLHASRKYVLSCQLYVRPTAVLVIEPGTTIAAVWHDSSHESMPALIVERGAKIYANGTRELPITFTAVGADSEDSDDQRVTDESEDGTHQARLGLRGKWGGIIILGRAPTSHTTTPYVEGLDKYAYGGTDPEDDSGALSFVRIWHSGAVIGANNELNGLTLAGARRRRRRLPPCASGPLPLFSLAVLRVRAPAFVSARHELAHNCISLCTCRCTCSHTVRERPRCARVQAWVAAPR